MTISDNGHRVLEFEKPERCPCCGQVIRSKPSDDPIRDEVLDVLQRIGGYVPMREIVRVLPFQIHRATVWRRLSKLEEAGIIKRDPEHPYRGWHYLPASLRQQPLEMVA
jgi:hypothetical protein